MVPSKSGSELSPLGSQSVDPANVRWGDTLQAQHGKLVLLRHLIRLAFLPLSKSVSQSLILIDF